MSREITMSTMVKLPRLNSLSAAALGEQLLTAADAVKGSGLPLSIERPRARLESAVLALKGQIKPDEMIDTRAGTAADRNLDNCWRAFYKWLGVMAGMPTGSIAELDQMKTLYGILFGEGLSFIKLSFREEWTESETRLQTLAEGGYEPVIEKLGGAPLIKNLKEAHARYGEVLNIKTPVKDEENGELRKRLNNLTSAMKDYVIKTAAYADPDEPGSAVLSNALLRPLAQWKDTPTRSTFNEDTTTSPSAEPSTIQSPS